MAIKSSFVSTPIGEDFAKATLTLMLLSSALNCSNLYLISFEDCSYEINFLSVSN